MIFKQDSFVSKAYHISNVCRYWCSVNNSDNRQAKRQNKNNNNDFYHPSEYNFKSQCKALLFPFIHSLIQTNTIIILNRVVLKQNHLHFPIFSQLLKCIRAKKKYDTMMHVTNWKFYLILSRLTSNAKLKYTIRSVL